MLIIWEGHMLKPPGHVYVVQLNLIANYTYSFDHDQLHGLTLMLTTHDYDSPPT